jgi:hypothetical protein
VIDYLRTFFKGENVAVACIFCNYKEQTTQSVSELLASILKQIIQDQSAVSENIKKFYKEFRYTRPRRPKLADLTIALQSEIRTYSKVFLVVDALDECLEGVQGDLIKRLGSLAHTLYLMVTSRPLDLLEQQFHSSSRLDINANNGDIRKYIEGRIMCEPRLAPLITTEHSLQESIVNKLVVKASGVYVFLVHHHSDPVSGFNLFCTGFCWQNYTWILLLANQIVEQSAML